MKRATVLDLLRMSSALEGGFNWFKMEGGRTSLYFDRGSNKEPGALFSYDSSGSYMLGIIVERLTGMDFLTYLRGKCLDRIGFSKDSCCLSVRGGGAWGDSGVMATLRDLALFARFVMMGGAWEGEQLIDPDYIAFITDTSDNATSAYGFEYFDGYGYGGQFWGAPRGGYAMLGMGNQFAFCLPERDFIFVVHSDNQGSPISGYQFLFDAVCDLLVDNLSDEPLPPDPRALAVLKEHTETRKLFALTGKTTSPMADAINGKTYIAEENRMGIRWLRVELNGDTGVLHYENKTGVKALPFGLSHNVFGEFPEEGYSDLVGGIPAPGHKYASATSAAWVASNQLYIRVQIIDKYFGNLAICMGFVDDRLSVRMVKCAEAFLDEYEGLLNARVES